MKHTKSSKKLLCLVLVMLLAAAALTLTGCTNKTPSAATPGDIPSESLPASNGDLPAATELGAGEKLFYFDVTFTDETVNHYAIHTDAETVGDALTAEGLIDGEVADYGLYVKTVDGETLDWDTDGMYWAFYENGDYAMTGVDSTAITDGATYAFVATSG